MKKLILCITSILVFITSCGISSSTTSSESLSTSTPTSNESILSSTSANSENTSTKPIFLSEFNDEDKDIILDKMYGEKLPFVPCDSYTLSLSEEGMLIINFINPRVNMPNDLYNEELTELGFTLFNEELSDLYPYYLSTKELDIEVFAKVAFLYDEDTDVMQVNAYVEDNSMYVSKTFPNNVIMYYFDYNLPEISAQYFMPSIGLNSGWEYYEITIICKNIKETTKEYKEKLTSAGFICDNNDDLFFATKTERDIRMLCYLDENNLTIKTHRNSNDYSSFPQGQTLLFSNFTYELKDFSYINESYSIGYMDSYQLIYFDNATLDIMEQYEQLYIDDSSYDCIDVYNKVYRNVSQKHQIQISYDDNTSTGCVALINLN